MVALKFILTSILFVKIGFAGNTLPKDKSETAETRDIACGNDIIEVYDNDSLIDTQAIPNPPIGIIRETYIIDDDTSSNTQSRSASVSYDYSGSCDYSGSRDRSGSYDNHGSCDDHGSYDQSSVAPIATSSVIDISNKLTDDILNTPIPLTYEISIISPDETWEIYFGRNIPNTIFPRYIPPNFNIATEVGYPGDTYVYKFTYMESFKTPNTSTWIKCVRRLMDPNFNYEAYVLPGVLYIHHPLHTSILLSIPEKDKDSMLYAHKLDLEIDIAVGTKTFRYRIFNYGYKTVRIYQSDTININCLLINIPYRLQDEIAEYIKKCDTENRVEVVDGISFYHTILVGTVKVFAYKYTDLLKFSKMSKRKKHKDSKKTTDYYHSVIRPDALKRLRELIDNPPLPNCSKCEMERRAIHEHWTQTIEFKNRSVEVFGYGIILGLCRISEGTYDNALERILKHRAKLLKCTNSFRMYETHRTRIIIDPDTPNEYCPRHRTS